METEEIPFNRRRFLRQAALASGLGILGFSGTATAETLAEVEAELYAQLEDFECSAFVAGSQAEFDTLGALEACEEVAQARLDDGEETSAEITTMCTQLALKFEECLEITET